MTTVFFCIVTFLFFFFEVGIAQKNWLWSNGGVGNDEAFDNAKDQNGNIFTIG